MANEFESGRLPQGAVSRSTPATLALPQPLSALLAAQVILELATAAIFVLQGDVQAGHAAGRRAALVAPISTGPFASGRYAGWSRCCRALLCVLRMFVCHSGDLCVWLARVPARLVEIYFRVFSDLP